MPSPVSDDSARIGAPAKPLWASRARTSAWASASRSGVTRSHLVSATTPRVSPSRSRMARCSRVCGIGPSSAATTSITWSMPVAPASMLRTSFSWPGTSTKPSTSPSGSGLVGEAEVDGDAAFLLFLQAIGVDAGQRLDQRGLAMVDMTCGSDDQGDTMTRNEVVWKERGRWQCGRGRADAALHRVLRPMWAKTIGTERPARAALSRVVSPRATRPSGALLPLIAGECP